MSIHCALWIIRLLLGITGSNESGICHCKAVPIGCASALPAVGVGLCSCEWISIFPDAQAVLRWTSTHAFDRLPITFSYQVSSAACRAFSSALFDFHHHPLTIPVKKPPKWPRWSISALPILIFLGDNSPTTSIVKITNSNAHPFSCTHSCQLAGMNQTVKVWLRELVSQSIEREDIREEASLGNPYSA